MYPYKVKHIVLPHHADDGNDDDLEGIADKAMRVGWLSHRTVAFLLYFAHGGEVRDASERLAMRANELSQTRQGPHLTLGGKWIGEPD